MKLWTTILGIAAACGTTAAWLPQLIKTWRTRSAHDFSWLYLLLFSSGVTLWIVYGVLRHDPVIIGANAITIAIVAGVIVIKLRE